MGSRHARVHRSRGGGAACRRSANVRACGDLRPGRWPGCSCTPTPPVSVHGGPEHASTSFVLLPNFRGGRLSLSSSDVPSPDLPTSGYQRALSPPLCSLCADRFRLCFRRASRPSSRNNMPEPVSVCAIRSATAREGYGLDLMTSDGDCLFLPLASLVALLLSPSQSAEGERSSTTAHRRGARDRRPHALTLPSLLLTATLDGTTSSASIEPSTRSGSVQAHFNSTEQSSAACTLQLSDVPPHRSFATVPTPPKISPDPLRSRENSFTPYPSPSARRGSQPQPLADVRLSPTKPPRRTDPARSITRGRLSEPSCLHPLDVQGNDSSPPTQPENAEGTTLARPQAMVVPGRKWEHVNRMIQSAESAGESVEKVSINDGHDDWAPTRSAPLLTERASESLLSRTSALKIPKGLTLFTADRKSVV